MRLTDSGLRLRPALAAVMAFALCIAMTVRSSAADVSEWIPSDALFVFKVNNLQRVNQEAGAMMREFGIAEQSPEMADPLAAFQAESGIREGLNLDGNLAFYVANGDLEGDVPPLVVLVPVSDYQAFLKNFTNPQDVGGGISSVTIGENDEPAFVMQMGEYAGMSPMQELLTKPEQGITFGGVTGQMMQERDVIAYVNFEQLGPILLAKLQEQNARDQAKEEIRTAIEENEQFAKFQPVANAAVDQLFTMAENFLRDASAAAVTLDLNDQGIRFGGAGQFKPGSYFANLFAKLNASGEPLLSGLPEANYIMFGGSTDNQAANQQFFNDVLGPIVNELKQVAGTEKIAEYIEAVQTQISSAGETRFGVFAPSGPLGASPLLQQVVIQGGDVQKLLQSQRRVAELQPEIMAEFFGEEMDEMGMGMMNMKYEEKAKSLGGVDFDKLSADMEAAQGQDQQAMGGMPMKMLFGPDGPTTYLGVVDDKLVMVSGLGDPQITQVVEAVRGNDAPLADDAGVQLVKGQLMDRHSAIVFFRPDELVRSGVGYARQMGMNMPIQLPEDLPPVGFAVGPTENAFQGEAFFPKDLISALIVAGLQAQQQLGGMGDDGM